MPDSAPGAEAAALALRRLLRLYDEVLAPSGLTIAQFSVLRELLHRRDCAPGVVALAERLLMGRSTLERHLRALQWKGLAEVLAPAPGRRARAFAATAAGARRADEAALLWSRAERRLERADAALARLGAALERLAV